MAGSEARVIIVGGGIAGPALGLFLHDAGFAVTVYEAKAAADEEGGGINLAPNGMNVLALLGLAEAMRERGASADTFCFRNEGGRVLACYPNGGGEYGQRSLNARRSDLSALLHAALAERGVAVEYGRQLVGVTDNGSSARVVAHFADGGEAVGAVLVGADGVRSAVRRVALPDSPAPEYVGIIGVGGFTPEQSLPPLPARDRAGLTFTYGRDGFFGYGGARPGEVMWWSNLRRERELGRDELAAIDTETVRAGLLAIYGGYHEPIPSIIEASGPIVRHNVFDVRTLPAWHRGRVVLIGDAAHAVSPNSGQGASLALEDAVCLAIQLRAHRGDVQRAFAAFEGSRRARCERVVAEGRRRSADKKKVSYVGALIRNAILSTLVPLFARREQKWLYSYRVEW